MEFSSSAINIRCPDLHLCKSILLQYYQYYKYPKIETILYDSEFKNCYSSDQVLSDKSLLCLFSGVLDFECISWDQVIIFTLYLLG
jgi:hypothetical protein